MHDLHLYYFENPRSEEPKGVVNLKGAHCLAPRVRIADAYSCVVGVVSATRNLACCGSMGLFGQAYCDA